MLCTSILSEVVLGFLLWSGWLGTMPTSDAPQPEYGPAYQAYPALPVGTSCPQACVECPAPVCYSQPTSPCPVAPSGVEVCKILSLPPHLAACDMKEVFNTAAATSGHGKKPCYWKIQSIVKSPVADGLEVEITLHADNDGVKEEYKAKKVLVFDSVTDVTLSGNHPEPVCIRVVARRPVPQVVMTAAAAVWSAPCQAYGMPMMPSMPMYCPPPTPPVAQIFINDASPRRIPEPIPVYGPYPSYVPPSPIMPASLTLPAPTLVPVAYPVHRASVRLVYESGKPRLSVKSEGMTTECLRMKLEAGAAGAVRLSAGKNRVHLAGTKWKAEAERIELGDDGRIVLTGHVKLMSDKLGVCAVIKADRVCVEVKAGKFEKIVASK
jgi:hypothetical protein